MSKRQPAPVLFGARMRLRTRVEDGVHVWARRFGPFELSISYDPHLKRPYFWQFCAWGGSVMSNSEPGLRGAQQRLEALLREAGRGLPAQALVSKREWKATNG